MYRVVAMCVILELPAWSLVHYNRTALLYQPYPTTCLLTPRVYTVHILLALLPRPPPPHMLLRDDRYSFVILEAYPKCSVPTQIMNQEKPNIKSDAVEG